MHNPPSLSGEPKLPCFSYLVRGKSFSFYRGKIRRFSVSTKFLHVIRSDFQQNAYDLKLRLKKDSISYGAHLYVFAVSKTMFCGINQYITK